MSEVNTNTSASGLVAFVNALGNPNVVFARSVFGSYAQLTHNRKQHIRGRSIVIPMVEIILSLVL